MHELPLSFAFSKRVAVAGMYNICGSGFDLPVAKLMTEVMYGKFFLGLLKRFLHD